MPGTRKLSSLSILSLCALVGLFAFSAYQYVLAKPIVAEDEFGARVRSYLLSNPQVLREVIVELNKQDKLTAADKQNDLLPRFSSELKADGYSYVGGNPEGDVTIVEFFDYRCGYCKQSFPELMKMVEDDGNIRLILKELPVLGEASYIASQAAIASIEQGKYLEFHTALMSNRGGLSSERVLSIASDVGLDVEALQADMQSDKTQEVIEKNHALAKQLDISGTPAFLIGEEFIPGAISGDQMRQLVAIAREKPETTADKES